MPFVLAALGLHAVLLGVASRYAPPIRPSAQLPPLELVSLPPMPPEAVPAEPTPPPEPTPEQVLLSPPEPSFDGQIVEVAAPDVEQMPENARFLAEHNQRVEQETRSQRFMVNPEVLAPKYSKNMQERKKEAKASEGDAESPSETPKADASERFDPKRNGTLAQLPQKLQLASAGGSASDAEEASELSGAPQNDRLDVKRGDSTQLNTKEFLYASYLLRIRRLVNYYWNQNLENLPASVRLARPEYTTQVRPILDASGNLESIAVQVASGSPELDNAVIQAFRLAGPYPNPPEGLVGKDGRVVLPNMGFTVTLGMAQNPYQGVDPRAGVRYPGLTKGGR